MKAMWQRGFSAGDILGTIFRVLKSSSELNEAEKLGCLSDVGFVQMRVGNGLGTLVQLYGLVARLCERLSGCRT